MELKAAIICCDVSLRAQKLEEETYLLLFLYTLDYKKKNKLYKREKFQYLYN